MKTERNNDINIKQLIDKLNQLEIEQQEINKDINNVKKDIENIKRASKEKKEDERRQREYVEYERSNTFEIGDKIKINNPKQQNDNKGTVTGYTPTGYVKITTEQGTKTRRIPANLRIIEKAR